MTLAFLNQTQESRRGASGPAPEAHGKREPKGGVQLVISHLLCGIIIPLPWAPIFLHKLVGQARWMNPEGQPFLPGSSEPPGASFPAQKERQQDERVSPASPLSREHHHFPQLFTCLEVWGQSPLLPPYREESRATRGYLLKAPVPYSLARPPKVLDIKSSLEGEENAEKPLGHLSSLTSYPSGHSTPPNSVGS